MAQVPQQQQPAVAVDMIPEVRKERAPEPQSIPYSPLAQVLVFVGCLVACFGTAALGGAITGPAIKGWYKTINKPSWNPPNWLFPVVWTTLFLLMTISSFLVARQGLKARAVPLLVFTLQLLLNFGWNLVFFGLHNFWGAFAEAIVFWIAIVASALLFYRDSKIAGILMVPYILWVAFATYLTYTLAKLNPSAMFEAAAAL